MEYGQFCPVAKATEIVGEKWTLLVIRELLMGRGVGEFQHFRGYEGKARFSVKIRRQYW